MVQLLSPARSITDCDETKGFSHETMAGDHQMRCDDSNNHYRSTSTDANNAVDFCPHLTETSSAKSSSEEYIEDNFDMDGLPMPRIYSSTIPIVVEVAPRRGFFHSKDPLFNGICLYNGHMTSTQRNEAVYKGSRENEGSPYKSGRLSWILSSIFSDTS